MSRFSTPAQGSTALPPALPPAIERRLHSEHDMRRKRPPALSFALRIATLSRVARVVSLLALDFVGVALAIFTALILKAIVLDHVEVSAAVHETERILAFAYLLTALLFARSGLYAERAQRPGLSRIVGSLFQVAFVALIFAVVSGEHFSSFYLFYGSLAFALLFARSGLYSERAQRPGLSRIVGSLFQVAFVALIFAVVSGEHFSSYYLFYGSLAFALLYVSSLRAGYDWLTGAALHAAGYRRRAVLVGDAKHIGDLARALGDASHAPVEVVGYLSADLVPASGVRPMGLPDDLDQVLARERIDEVIIAGPDFPQVQAVELVDRCHQRGVRVRLAPSTMEILIHRAEFVPGQSVPLFELGPPVFEGVDFALKRSFDIVGATLLLLLLSPLLIAIVIAVRVSSRGPVVFRSMRRGIGQRPFACLKFRTMHTDAEQRQVELEELNEATGALFKIRDDPRLTRVGRLLRRFSLDELPQLINVLRGEMSLVGPRPLPQRDYEMLADWHRKRYLVLPGITGLWQVSGRSELDFDDLVHLDFLYLEHWSLALDLTILLKTVPAVLSRRGAY